jgi:hypothetical protein
MNEAPDPAPTLRNSLRDLFALLGITATVQSGTVGTRQAIVIQALSLGDAQKLVEALDDSPRTRVKPR